MTLVGWLGVTTATGPAQATRPSLAAAGETVAGVLAGNARSHDDEGDQVWSSDQVIPITLTGSGATSASDAVTADDAGVTITAAGTYQLSGSLTCGNIKINTPDTELVRLVLNGVDVSSDTTPAIEVVSAGEVMIVLAEGSRNVVADPPQQADTNAHAAIFSSANLTVTGPGTLEVTGNAADGIASSAGLVIDSAVVVVTAADDGIRGKDYLKILDSDITVTSAGDGLKSNNDKDSTMGYVSLATSAVVMASGGDGVAARTDVVASGGTVSIVSGGGSDTGSNTSAKGVKAGGSIVLETERFVVDAADDAIHSDSAVTIAAGDVVLASGDDAVHAESSVVISAGTVTVTRAYEGIEALTVTISGGCVDIVASDDGVNAVQDGLNEFAVSETASVTISGGTVLIDAAVDGIDSNGSITFSGGTTVVTGSALRGGGEGALDANGPTEFRGGVVLGAAETSMAVMSPPSTDGQGWVAPNLGSDQSAGTIVHLVAEDEVVVSYQSTKKFRELAFSSSDIVNGQSYDVYVGGSIAGTQLNGMATEGDLNGATKIVSVTAGEYSGGLIGFPPWGFPSGFPTDFPSGGPPWFPTGPPPWSPAASSSADAPGAAPSQSPSSQSSVGPTPEVTAAEE